jgi:hypothetical protein
MGIATFEGTAPWHVNVQARVIVCPLVNVNGIQATLFTGTDTATVTAVVELVMVEGVIVIVAPVMAEPFNTF